MAIVPDGGQRAHLPPHLEALELQDIGARDCTPTQDPHVFRNDALTEAEIDVLFVAEMVRRDRVAACPAGYKDAGCEACGTALFVPAGQGGDVLCPQCLREGEAVAAAEASPAASDGDHDPRPPAAGAMHPEYAEFAATAARMLDDELCVAIGVADAEPGRFRFDDGQREAFVAAMSAEVVRRLDGCRAA